MFWFDKENESAVFCDHRSERHMLKDSSVNGGQRELVIAPGVISDFTALPFPSNHFQLVVFDPPHFDKSGPKSWIRAKYGALEGDWREMLRGGFSECFRVLQPFGTLIFKWSSVQIPVSEILKLTPVNPMFGHKSGKQSLTHWITFQKTTSARWALHLVKLARSAQFPTPICPNCKQQMSRMDNGVWSCEQESCGKDGQI
jgi:hypothetical protein